MFNLNFLKKSSTIVFAIASLFVTISAGFMAVDYSKIASAAPVYACAPTETISGTNCLTSRTTTPKFELKCATGYTLMDTSCTKFNSVSCSSYLKGTNAENGFCKFSTTNIYGGEILNYDGRECNGNGYSFYRYNVGLDFRDTTGPIICANTYSEVIGVQDFRWMPKNITEISNLETIQTETVLSPCPTGYSEVGTNQCSRPATIKTCDAGGEYSELKSTTPPSVSCTPCPAGFYCPSTPSGATTTTVCANGGTIVGTHCQAPIKYSVTDYTTGCGTGYIKLDQTCAIKQFRDRDYGCSYYFASNNEFVKAKTEADGRCSTGGRTDFESTNIFKVSDLNCAGPGTGWYNYNVAYDPLVCGSVYDPYNKAAFRWYPDSYTKITGLQKLPFQKKVCPNGWIDKDVNSQYCYQEPITLTFTTPIPCNANTYSGPSAISCTPCPAGSESPAKSTSVNQCVYIPCTNGATNPPTCNICPSGKVFVNQTCVANCTNGATNPPECNVCPNDKTLFNGVCYSPCINGAINPATCDTCPTSQTLVSGKCVNPCTNGAINPPTCNVCPDPKVLENGNCITPVVSSSSLVSSSVQSSSIVPSSVSSSSATPSSVISSSSVLKSSSVLSSSSSSAIPLCKIVGKVYIDNNKNGVQDSNEPDGNLPGGINVVLAKDGVTILTTTPNVNGNYSFENILCNAGIHTVTISVPSSTSYIISNSTENGEGTGSNPTTINVNSNLTKTFDAGKDGIYKPVVASSSVSSSVVSSSLISSSSSAIPLCKIVGKVYIDTNKNGVQDSNEPDGNLPGGINVVLAKDGVTILTTTPNVNGNYSFDNLPCNAGVHTVTVVVPSPIGYFISNSTENGEGTGSNPTTINVNSNITKTFDSGKDGIYKPVIVISSSSVSSSVISSSSVLKSSSVLSSSSSSAIPLCKIVGKVYIDTNKNGVQDSNEPDGNLPGGITVVLAKDGVTVVTVVPNANGTYSFDNLPCNAGVHTVTVVVPSPTGYFISNSTENGEGTGSNPTTINVNSNITKTFDSGKDGIYLVVPINPSSANTIINNYYTYNNPTNNNTINPTNTFNPTNNVVVNTQTPTTAVVTAPQAPVVYLNSPVVPTSVSPSRTVYETSYSTVRTGGMNYVIAFIAAISALIVGVVISNNKSKFSFNLREWNGSTVSNL
jgi:SdrD B-like domain